MTEAHFEDWYPRRTGQELPPSIRLMLLSRLQRIPKLETARLLVVKTPTPQILDGLLQHPTTRDLLGERLGEMSVTISESQVPQLQDALKSLGIAIETETIERL